MVTELYVLVHEFAIQTNLMIQDSRTLRAGRADNEIRRLRNEGKTIISHEGSPRLLPTDLPKPSKDLTIKVMGAYRDYCVTLQYLKLKMEGYQAEIHEPGCMYWD